MLNKITLMRGATALLYLGPLLAGLAGSGWAMVPVFSLLFVLWLLFLRPETWPGTASGARNGASWLQLATRTLVQVLLVTVFFGIGRGIGGVLGAAIPIPSWLPVVLSTLAILVGRLIWNPDAAAQAKTDTNRP